MFWWAAASKFLEFFWSQLFESISKLQILHLPSEHKSEDMHSNTTASYLFWYVERTWLLIRISIRTELGSLARTFSPNWITNWGWRSRISPTTEGSILFSSCFSKHSRAKSFINTEEVARSQFDPQRPRSTILWTLSVWIECFVEHILQRFNISFLGFSSTSLE